MTDLKPCEIWAVVYGNYYPSEVDSLYSDKSDAEKRRDELNDAKDSTGMWEVETMQLWNRRVLDPDVRKALEKVRGSMAIALAHFDKTWRSDPNVVAATSGEVQGWIDAIAAILKGAE